MSPVDRRFALVAATVACLAAAGCLSAQTTFYEVTSSRLEECAIRVNGEFCAEPEQFDPPVSTVWTVEVPRDPTQVARLYVDGEVWVLDPLSSDDDPNAVPRTAARSLIVTAGDARCTTTTSETLQFSADRTNFSGTLARSTVLTGPGACGDTPVGERTEDDLEGSAVNANGDPVGP